MTGPPIHPPDPWAGVWIAEDINLIATGVRSENWIDASIGVISAGLDGLALVLDPLGNLLQYGVAWLIEHVRPLSEALDWLAGDAAQIAAQAQAWRTVAGGLTDQASALHRSLRWDVTEWTGAAAEAYRTSSDHRVQRLRTLGTASETMATMVEAAGTLTATVRLLIRDAIATVVSRLIVYAGELVATAGLATPVVAAQVSSLCASWGAKIARWLRGLLTSLRNLGEAMTRLGSAVRQLRAPRRTEPALHRTGDGIVRNGRKILMTEENVAAVATKYGIDTEGVEIVINKFLCGGGPGKEFFGTTAEDGTVTLTRDAFISEQQLAQTLAHERFHVEEIRRGMQVPRNPRQLQAWEDRAYAYEHRWWQEHKHIFDGE